MVVIVERGRRGASNEVIKTVFYILSRDYDGPFSTNNERLYSLPRIFLSTFILTPQRYFFVVTCRSIAVDDVIALKLKRLCFGYPFCVRGKNIFKPSASKKCISSDGQDNFLLLAIFLIKSFVWEKYFKSLSIDLEVGSRQCVWHKLEIFNTSLCSM